MRIGSIVVWAFAVMVPASVVAPPTPTSRTMNDVKTIPLILEKDEGERRVMRGWPGHPDPGETIILKVDPKNGGSSHLVLLTGEVAPGKRIEAHKHPEVDEIFLLRSGTARVHLGETVRVVHAGATVFIPANTWISFDNIGDDAMSFVGIFSAPGFEELMRDASAREGEKNVPFSETEEAAFEKKHVHAAIYKQP
jgi:quercetin dioxygenase-like cupin family protein